MILTNWLCYLSRWLIWFQGWEQLGEKEKEQFKKYPYVLILYPHTSYWDFFYMVLYKLAFPDELGNMYSLVKPQILDRFPFLENYGLIRSARLEDKNSGFTQKITQFFQIKKNKGETFKLLISPKGSMSKTTIRTGYYHIAKELNLVIMVAGIDYARRKVTIGSENLFPSLEPDGELPQEDVVRRTFLLKCKEIEPWHPELEHYESHYRWVPKIASPLFYAIVLILSCLIFLYNLI